MKDCRTNLCNLVNYSSIQNHRCNSHLKGRKHDKEAKWAHRWLARKAKAGTCPNHSASGICCILLCRDRECVEVWLHTGRRCLSIGWKRDLLLPLFQLQTQSLHLPMLIEYRRLWVLLVLSNARHVLAFFIRRFGIKSWSSWWLPSSASSHGKSLLLANWALAVWRHKKWDRLHHRFWIELDLKPRHHTANSRWNCYRYHWGCNTNRRRGSPSL